MGKFIEDVLQIDRRVSGDVSVSDQMVEGEVFGEFALGPRNTAESSYEVCSCQFVDCLVEGAFKIFWGVELRDVGFHDVVTKGGKVISNLAFFENVVIEGGKGHGELFVKDSYISDGELRTHLGDLMSEWARRVDTILDVSGYFDSVTILGWPVSKIEIDEKRQVRMKGAWFESIDWEQSGIPKDSFWFRRLRYMRNHSDGVFSLPMESEADYKRTMDEMEKLQSLGIPFL